MNTAIDYSKISVAERIQLVQDIWDSIAADTAEVPGLRPEQREELDRRLQAHRDNPASAVPWEQVRQELFQPYS